jgi:sugar transferase EpsL
VRYADGATKRASDIVIALLALVVLLPVIAATALLVRLRLGTPVLFRHVRPGRYGKPFTLCKFRSMIEARDGAGNLLPDPARLTMLGRVLRATSVDELPELFNVLQGTMSIVGPRPLLMDYLPLYSAEQARRHDVRPGITGLAQISGRNALSWDEKFRLDVWYVEHASFWLDMKIIAMTIAETLSRRGITSPNRDYVERFAGSAGAKQAAHDGV